MSQLLQLDFFLRDQASVDTFTDYMNQSISEMTGGGFKEIARYVNQDNPHHLVFLMQWPSREAHDAWLKKLSAQPQFKEMMAALHADKPRETWLNKVSL